MALPQVIGRPGVNLRKVCWGVTFFPMTTLQARRKLIVIVLLCIAVCGAVLRHFADRGSTLRDFGTLLMLLWLPIIGNVIAWLVARVRRPAGPAPAPDPFAATAGAFEPHLLVALKFRAPQLPVDDVPLAEGEHRCALVVDNEGFSARWFVAPGDTLRLGTEHALQVEFLAPAVALPRFPPQATFRMLVGSTFVGDGRVRKVLATAALWWCCGLAGMAADTAHAAPDAGARWGAIASLNRWYGYSFSHPTRAAAEQAALNQCNRLAGRAGKCSVRLQFDRSCGALAEGNYGEWATATAPTRDAAGKAAAVQCDNHLPAEPCKVVVNVCSTQ